VKVGCKAHRPVCVVRRDRNEVAIRGGCNLAKLADSANMRGVRLKDADRPALQIFLGNQARDQPLTGRDGNVSGVLNLQHGVYIFRRNRLFQEERIIGLKQPRDAARRGQVELRMGLHANIKGRAAFANTPYKLSNLIQRFGCCFQIDVVGIRLKKGIELARRSAFRDEFPGTLRISLCRAERRVADRQYPRARCQSPT
jgi:hypothetical protein